MTYEAKGTAFADSRFPTPDSRQFTWPLRVYWEDTDAGGVVYHANYLRFFERARSEWLRVAGFDQRRLREETGIVFVVRRMELAFNAPAMLDDCLVATVQAMGLRRASFRVHQELMRESSANPLATGHVHIACLDADTFRPRPIPEFVLQEIAKTCTRI